MAAQLNDNELTDVRQLLAAWRAGETVSDMELVDRIYGNESFEIVQGGKSKRATLEQVLSAQAYPDGTYPDVSLNRATIKKYASQESPLVTIDDNLAVRDRIFEKCYPCILNQQAEVIAKLNGSNQQLTADGGDTTIYRNYLTPWMVHVGGIFFKYEYNAALNTKSYKLSHLPVKGYTYIGSRFLSMFPGSIKSIEGTTVLSSVPGAWSTQSVNTQTFQTYAKNLGSNYRVMADQDQELYMYLYWLMEGTVNSQALYPGITSAPSAWNTISRSSEYDDYGDAGQSTYGQPHKNGETLSIIGHKGEKTIAWSGINVKTNKWLWRENELAGPYYKFRSGRLFVDGEIWDCKSLDDIVFTKDLDKLKLVGALLKPASNGWNQIAEFVEHTNVISGIGGSASTYMCDQAYLLAPPAAGVVYVPARLGYAIFGSYCGLGLLYAGYGLGDASARCGVSLAASDPADTRTDGDIII